MFVCRYCDKECKSLQGLSKHETHCHSNPQRKPQHNPNDDLGDYHCQYCQRYCHSKNSLINHERLCKKNPNHQTTIMHTKEWQEEMRSRIDREHVWNKGLTKESDVRIAAISNHLKNAYASGILISKQKNKPRTEEEKKQISETMKKNGVAGGLRQGSGRGKKGWYKGFFCDSTYELVYVIYNLDKKINFKRCNRKYEYEYSGEKHLYFPDFELDDGSLVEIKGYHTDLVDIKIASVKDRKIVVLYESDLQYAFDWVKNNYTYAQLSDLYENNGGLA